MENEVAIRVEHVSKTFKIPHERISSLRGAAINLFRSGGYEKFQALDNVSFEVKKGEFFGIIGRNGSGKSTLLKILAGIYEADQGTVRIDGRISPFLELGIGFNPELSGRDNVYLNATVLGMTKKQIDAKFNSIVAFSELERFIDQKLKNYSSGMSVRLAFSVAIHANRDILLMDEVLAVGDSNFQSKCLEEFNKYKSAGKTVILVTHDIATIQRYCDRAMLLRNGKIAKIGKAEEVGNEYIYQNMSDEERRILAEEKRRKIFEEKKQKIVLEEENKRKIEEEKKEPARNASHSDAGGERKNKIAEIIKVEFLDKDRKEKNVFETGEAIDIKIYFKVNKKVELLNFGVGLHSVFGGQIFGYNTQADKFKIFKHNNFIILHFDTMPVLKGDYFVNVSCFCNVGESCYDFKPRYKTIKIFSKGLKNNYVGFCDISHKWEL